MKPSELNSTREAARRNEAVFDLTKEVARSPVATWERPLWVRWVEKPTTEIDWGRMERFDGRKMQQVGWADYVGREKAKTLTELRGRRTRQWMRDGRPGYGLRDRALDLAGSQAGSVTTSFLGSWAETSEKKDPFRQQIFGPEEMGINPWEATPEENSRLVRTVLRHFGADQVGFVELDERTRKFIYSYDALDGKLLSFEDAERAYETAEKRVIPNKAKWVIVFSVQLSEELIKRTYGPTPTALSSAATGLAYARGRNIMDRLQTFLHILGYEALQGSWFNGLGIAGAFAVMAGLGELSRLNRIISPEYGPMQRFFRLVTDLPVAPTKPIDAGIMRFCRSCKRCAEACPASVLSMDTEPSWEVKGAWNNPGHRAYFEYAPRCRSYWSIATVGCARCFAVCPFSRKDKSFIHKIVATTVSLTPVLNRFFTRMHHMMGYETPRHPESWWGLADMPPYGINTVKGTQLE